MKSTVGREVGGELSRLAIEGTKKPRHAIPRHLLDKIRRTGLIRSSRKKKSGLSDARSIV